MDGTGLDWYETLFRSYDPQIGRFHQMDAMADSYDDWSPYAFGLCNPISLNDPTGLEGEEKGTPGETADNPIMMETVTIKYTKKNKWGFTDWGLWVDRYKESGYTAMRRHLEKQGVDERGLRLFEMAYDGIGYRERLAEWDEDFHAFVEGALEEGLEWGLTSVGGGIAVRLGGKLVKWGYRAYKARKAAKAAAKIAKIGSKLEYLFGKATGSAHNIERSRGMLKQLESIGIFDNVASRSLLNNHLESVYSGTKGILQSNGRYLRESLLMGPNGGLKVESIWEGNKLITVKLYGGR